MLQAHRIICFNPRLREAGDYLLRIPCASSMGFNPRLREAGDQIHGFKGKADISFNPRLREAGDQLYKLVNARYEVSIHACVKQATRKVTYVDIYAIVSIHACVKQATIS